MCASSEEIFAKVSPALVQLNFFNKASLELEGSCTGFLVSSTGTAFTSSLHLKRFEGRKIIVVTQNGDEYDAEGTLLPEVPGLGFIQFEGSDLPCLKPNNKCTLEAGDMLYVAGNAHTHIYFEEAYLSNTDYPIAFPCDRIVGKIPEDCIGGPVLSEDGLVVGVVYDRQLQMGLNYRLSNLLQVGSKSSEWSIVRLWRQITGGLSKRFEGFWRS